jgi:uncharacterized protein YukE
MSIKLLAIELYRAQQNVARLARQQEEVAESPGGSLPAAFQEELRHAHIELQRLRQMLEEKKMSAVEHATARYGRNRF